LSDFYFSSEDLSSLEEDEKVNYKKREGDFTRLCLMAKGRTSRNYSDSDSDVSDDLTYDSLSSKVHKLEAEVGDLVQRIMDDQAQVRYSVAGRSGGWVTPCAILLPVKTHRGAVSQQHEEPGSPRCRQWSPVTSELRPARLAHTRRDGSRACHLVSTWPGR
jgi:hypothetical protein